MSNIVILKLKNGKGVYLDGDSITQEEALEIAECLCHTWGVIDQYITAYVLYDVKPRHRADCHHYTTLEDALEQAWFEWT